MFELTDASLLQSAIAHLQHLASVHQRRPKVGLVLDLIVRESLSEAQQDAQRYAQQTAYQGKITGHATGAECPVILNHYRGGWTLTVELI